MTNSIRGRFSRLFEAHDPACAVSQPKARLSDLIDGKLTLAARCEKQKLCCMCQGALLRARSRDYRKSRDTKNANDNEYAPIHYWIPLSEEAPTNGRGFLLSQTVNGARRENEHHHTNNGCAKPWFQ
jgi:hypothetical protein